MRASEAAFSTRHGRKASKSGDLSFGPSGALRVDPHRVYLLAQLDGVRIEVGLTSSNVGHRSSPRAHLTGRSTRFRRRDVRGCGEDSGGVAGARLGGAVTRHRAHRRSPRSRRDRERRHRLILQFGPSLVVWTEFTCQPAESLPSTETTLSLRPLSRRPSTPSRSPGRAGTSPPRDLGRVRSRRPPVRRRQRAEGAVPAGLLEG